MFELFGIGKYKALRAFLNNTWCQGKLTSCFKMFAITRPNNLSKQILTQSHDSRDRGLYHKTYDTLVKVIRAGGWGFPGEIFLKLKLPDFLKIEVYFGAISLKQ